MLYARETKSLVCSAHSLERKTDKQTNNFNTLVLYPMGFWNEAKLVIDAKTPQRICHDLLKVSSLGLCSVQGGSLIHGLLERMEGRHTREG